MASRIECCCCARQILTGTGTPDKWVTYGPVVFMGCGKVACVECSKDLDENGLFPEERSLY